MKNTLLITLILFFIPLYLSAEKTSREYKSIEELVNNGKISAKIEGTGSYQEDCINLHLENTTKDTIFILIEPGRRLISEDSVYQDILILKSYEIIVSPLASLFLKVYGFCCQSSHSAPKIGALFSIGKMAPEKWVKLAEYTNGKNFPPGALQHAVWVISDDHPISSIHHDKADKVYELKKFVANLKNIELPWYSLTFEKDTSRLFSGRAEKLWGTIDYRVKNNTVISINIRDSNGTVVKELIKEVAKGPGTYRYRIELSVTNWPKGEYSVYIIEDYSNINSIKKFNL
jgi:hypothetical protein